MEDTFPDLGSLSDEELKDLIDKLTEEENEISYKRRVLHGKIDILRAELVNRLRQKRERGDSLISGDDVSQLTEILAGKAQQRRRRTTPPPEAGSAAMAVHCPECGFVNPEGANYCQKCGAYLGGPTEGGDEPTTMTYTVDETGDMQPVDIDEVVEQSGAALVIRAGGGRAGESFSVDEDRVSIGRSPDAGVFLDDVTVSRNHALLVRRRDGLYIDDLGSLNGTYVNRRRIESHRLADGDEIQVGKYKLSYLEKLDGDGRLRAAGAPAGLGQPPAQGADDRRRLQDPRRASSTTSRSRRSATSRTRSCSTPRRTAGGYRLYSQSDVERLRTILRLQRDEFLPLRVIRQELAAGGDIDLGGGAERKPGGGAVRRAILVDTSRAYLTLDEVVEETGAREELIAELENFGIVQPEKREGRTVYDETDREIVRAANELSRVGVGARNLRVFRSSADREANLLEALLGPSLRSRNPERRKEALESLESLAATVSHLKHLLLVRDLRRLAGD